MLTVFFISAKFCQVVIQQWYNKNQTAFGARLSCLAYACPMWNYKTEQMRPPEGQGLPSLYQRDMPSFTELITYHFNLMGQT